MVLDRDVADVEEVDIEVVVDVEDVMFLDGCSVYIMFIVFPAVKTPLDGAGR